MYGNINFDDTFGMDEKERWNVHFYGGGRKIMEKFFEKSEIKSIPVQLFVMSFIRVVMEDVGRSMDEGIILIADDMPGKTFREDLYSKSEKC